jgi:hypothetical protein
MNGSSPAVRVEQQRLAIGTARRGLVFAQQQLVRSSRRGLAQLNPAGCPSVPGPAVHGQPPPLASPGASDVRLPMAMTCTPRVASRKIRNS